MSSGQEEDGFRGAIMERVCLRSGRCRDLGGKDEGGLVWKEKTSGDSRLRGDVKAKAKVYVCTVRVSAVMRKSGRGSLRPWRALADWPLGRPGSLK